MEVEPFDTSTADILPTNDATAEAIRFLYFSPAYQEVLKPWLEAMETGMIRDLVDPSQQRKWAKTDDYLRGGIIVLRAFLSRVEDFIAEDDARIADEVHQAKVNRYYADRMDEGRIPSMGFNYDPDEDY